MAFVFVGKGSVDPWDYQKCLRYTMCTDYFFKYMFIYSCVITVCSLYSPVKIDFLLWDIVWDSEI